MLGISITKLLFTIVVVLVVWKGFKWFKRLKKNCTTSAGNVNARGNQKKSSKSRGAFGVLDTVEMTKCTTCEIYIPMAGAVFCGKDGCPYPS